MSFGAFSMYSHVLGMDVPVNILLPERRKRETLDQSEKKYPVLYCLHGHSDDQFAWIRKSQIELLVRNLEVIVVMPTVLRSFYTNEKYGLKYFTFIAEELPVLISNMFHASLEKEDTYVMGNSMGGYGAFKLAMTYPEKFKAAASLSGALDPYDGFTQSNTDELFSMEGFSQNIKYVFGDKEEFYGSENDLYSLATKLSKYDGNHPLLYQCCGTDDPLTYSQNIKFDQYIKDNSLSLNRIYSFTSGYHNWDYWMPEAKKFIDLLNFKEIV